MAEHILVRRQGRGTFVATHSPTASCSSSSTSSAATAARGAEVELVSFERVRADEEAAQMLRLRAGEPVLLIENRLLLEGCAVIHDRLTLPPLLFKGLTEKRFRERSGTIYQLYQAGFGITVVHAVERARAALADRRTSRVLGLVAGAR